MTEMTTDWTNQILKCNGSEATHILMTAELRSDHYLVKLKCVMWALCACTQA